MRPSVTASLSKGLPFATIACALAVTASGACARELALAQGAITIHQAPAGQIAPTCTQLEVEARDALDNHLIARTQPEADGEGVCRYAISVPAQSAVWLRVRPVLVADAQSAPFDKIRMTQGADSRRASAQSVSLRFTIVAPSTYFFDPGQQKTVPLRY